MLIDLNGATIYAYTGGKAFDAAKPTLILVHGVLNDHSVWILQSRYIAHHGWNVLAIDQPGLGRSGGEPLRSVEEGADFVLALMDALKLERAALAGHSFGSLIALEAAARAPHRVSHLGLVGTAFPMRVSPALLENSVKAPMQAIDMVNAFSHSTLAPPPSSLGPGTWLYGGSRALMRRVLASNTKENVFHAGFKACDDYRGGEAAMEKVACPTAFILGAADQMTPPKAAQALVSRARHATVTQLDAGHAVMSEAPDGTLRGLMDLLRR